MEYYNIPFIILFIFTILILIIFFYIINKYIFIGVFRKIHASEQDIMRSTEHFCKVPDLNDRGEKNDKKVVLDDYKPQSAILTSSCDKYWKKWPLESTSTKVEDGPIVIKSDQLVLPKEKQFGNNNYARGLIDFHKLDKILSDKLNYDIFLISKELLIDPIEKKPVNYQYEVEFAYNKLNEKSWINRWYNYNPQVFTTFDYEEIKSPIEDINILNNEFKKRIDIRQKDILSDNEQLQFGLLKFDIFKYKIINMLYFNGDNTKPIYVIEIALFRFSDYYLNTFSYIGFIKDNKPYIINCEYIGRNTTDTVLLADFYNPVGFTEEVLNKNFTNSPALDKNPDVIVQKTKEHAEEYKLKNQYACFNINYDSGGSYILPYQTKVECESQYDPYGKSKTVGIFDKPCKENSECPFFKLNKNYDNDFGKCMENGQCQLPMNMKKLGYHYFLSEKKYKPLCNNCGSKEFKFGSVLDSCCDEQYDSEKYPFLNSPDYAFDNDFLTRQNFFNNKNCTVKDNNFDLKCKDPKLK